MLAKTLYVVFFTEMASCLMDFWKGNIKLDSTFKKIVAFILYGFFLYLFFQIPKDPEAVAICYFAFVFTRNLDNVISD